MKKYVLAITMALVVVVMAGSALAATATINVSATVAGICKFTTGAATLAFGTLTPDVAAADVTRTGTISFWCTKGVAAPAFDITTPVYTLGNILQMTGTAYGESLDYSIDSLTPDANPNTGPAAPRTLTISGRVYVAGANGYNAVSADTYNHNVTLTVTP